MNKMREKSKLFKIIYIVFWINPITLSFIFHFITTGFSIHFLEIDACLDKGSSWNYKLNSCNNNIVFDFRIYLFEILFIILVLSGIFIIMKKILPCFFKIKSNS